MLQSGNSYQDTQTKEVTGHFLASAMFRGKLMQFHTSPFAREIINEMPGAGQGGKSALI